jgi:hypothetical protein
MPGYDVADRLPVDEVDAGTNLLVGGVVWFEFVVELLVDETAGVGDAVVVEGDEDARPVLKWHLTDDDVLEPAHRRVEVAEPGELWLFEAVVEPLEDELFRHLLELVLRQRRVECVRLLHDVVVAAVVANDSTEHADVEPTDVAGYRVGGHTPSLAEVRGYSWVATGGPNPRSVRDGRLFVIVGDVVVLPRAAGAEFPFAAVRDDVLVRAFVLLALLDEAFVDERVEVGVEAAVVDFGGVVLLEFALDVEAVRLVEACGDDEEVALETGEVVHGSFFTDEPGCIKSDGSLSHRAALARPSVPRAVLRFRSRERRGTSRAGRRRARAPVGPHGHRPVVGFRPADVREVESFVGERPAERARRAFPDVIAPDGVLALPGDRCKATTD